MSGPDGPLRVLRVLAVCWRAAVAEQLEYRAELVASALMSAFWLAWAAIGVSVFFRFTGDLAGWTYPEVLVVVGLFFALNGIRQAFLEPNLDRVRDYVRRGTLDHLLLQPVDAQLLVSLRRIGLANLADPLLGAALVVTGLVLVVRAGTGVAPGPGDAAAFALLLLAALVLLYALELTLMALSVMLVGAEDLGTVSFSAVELSRFPVQAYGEPLRTVLVVVPVALLTTLPAQALLGRLPAAGLVASPAVAAAALAAATLLWRRALRGYTGASG